jgi:hypothetical protein
LIEHLHQPLSGMRRGAWFLGLLRHRLRLEYISAKAAQTGGVVYVIPGRQEVNRQADLRGAGEGLRQHGLSAPGNILE